MTDPTDDIVTRDIERAVERNRRRARNERPATLDRLGDSAGVELMEGEPMPAWAEGVTR